MHHVYLANRIPAQLPVSLNQLNRTDSATAHHGKKFLAVGIYHYVTFIFTMLLQIKIYCRQRIIRKRLPHKQFDIFIPDSLRPRSSTNRKKYSHFSTSILPCVSFNTSTACPISLSDFALPSIISRKCSSSLIW